MKKTIHTSFLIFISTFFSANVFSQPYADNNEAIFYRSTGKGIEYVDLPEKSKIWKQGMSFTCWNGDASCGNGYAIGSQNHPVMAAMGWGDYKWIAELCRYEKGHGIFGRELGAPAYYYANVLAAKMIALRDARAAGAYADAKDIAESLRCVWAYDALMASVTPRKNCWINLAGQIYTNTGDAAGYDGLTVAAAGDRWHTEDNISSDTHGNYLTWAIDWQPRSISPNTNFLNSNGKWWGESTAQITGVAYYNLTTDPEAFGLNAAERQKLQDVVNGDVNAAKWAAQVVANFGTWKDPNTPVADCYHKIRMRKTTLGTEIIYFNATNGNKPCEAATQIFNNGDYKSMRPNFYHGTGANNGYTCWVANGLIQADAPGDGAYVSMPEMGGTILWQVDIDGADIVFNGSLLSPAGQAAYPTGPDVGVTAIINPASSFNGTSVTPKVTVQNFGYTTVNNVYVSYQLDNGAMWTTTWRGTLAPNTSVNITLWNAPVTNGTYNLDVYTGGPNYQQDANTSNDSQSMTFTVGGTPTQTVDAGINSVVSPTSSNTTDSIQPIGKIKNFGTTALTSTTISYKLNNGYPITHAWTGNLASGASVNYAFPKVAIAQGTYTIQIYTSNPNNQTDANTANDSKSLVFNVASPYITDVEAVSVGEPFAYGCATSIQPLMVISNQGPVTLDQVTINYKVDANAVVSRTYSVATGTGLQTGSAMGLHGNTSAVTVGAHTLKMWSSAPNGVTDGDNSNDTVATSFTVAAGGQALPFSENFENVIPGQIPANWTNYNWDAFDEWFVYGMPGNKALAFNNYAYTGAVNTRDDITLPILDLTGNNSAFLTFDLAHASRPNAAKFDSLQVSVSVDCGLTFTSVWGVGGPGLNTTFDDSVLFIPAGIQDYKNFQVDLSAFISFNNVMVRFTNWSNNGNSTLIDNVNISFAATGVAENNSSVALNVFPVPATGAVTVQYVLQQSATVECTVANTLGQTVYAEDLGRQPAGAMSYRMDVSQLPAGVYQVVVSNGVSVSQKKMLVVK